jgi:hypothetical protein
MQVVTTIIPSNRAVKKLLGFIMGTEKDSKILEGKVI